MFNAENAPTKGLKAISKVMDELHDLISKLDLQFSGNVIIDITELLKEEYAEDLTQFKILTSSMCFIITDTHYSSDFPEGTDTKIWYTLLVFSNSHITNLEKIDVSDMAGLYDIDLSNYKYLPKCTFHVNTLYHKDQLNMIPAMNLIHEIIVK